MVRVESSRALRHEFVPQRASFRKKCEENHLFPLPYFISEGGGGARKGGARKTGVMGKGKFHHRRGAAEDDGGPGGYLSMDSDASFRTHMLFPGGRRDEDEIGRRGGRGRRRRIAVLRQASVGLGQTRDGRRRRRSGQRQRGQARSHRFGDGCSEVTSSALRIMKALSFAE